MDVDDPEVTHDYVIQQVRPDLYFTVCSVVLFFAYLTVGLRYYVRIHLLRAFRLDDWCLAGALFMFTVNIALLITFAALSLPQSFEAYEATQDLVRQFQSWVYALDQILVKVSLATFFRHVMPPYSWQLRTVTYSTIVFSLYTLTFSFVNLFQCGNPLSESEACIPYDVPRKLTYAAAVFNAIMDWLLVTLPITVVYKTFISRRAKFSVMLVMALGVSGSVVSVVRIVALRRADFEDFYTEHQTIRHYYFLNILENCIGIIAVSLAALRPLVKKVFGNSYARQTIRQLPTLETAHIKKKRHAYG
ncbi:hypothetical protein B9Z65_1761 [Elsinoe australis]|uniref:Rhodopsin domain-containing protein n=1 Tax=Elsinoe australis TaxID=40998 RepID=A0A2P7YKS4_9PEZI|nr:hypothetical protein B9Z65_1761 [Elsinoe australis]